MLCLLTVLADTVFIYGYQCMVIERSMSAFSYLGFAV